MLINVTGWIGIATFIVLIFRYLNSRIDKQSKSFNERISNVTNQFISEKLCEQKHIELNNRLDKGDERFSKIDKKLDEHFEILIRVDTTLKMLAKKNGIGQNE